MFSRVPQPLAFAEALLAQFGALSRETDIAALLGGFARAVGELSGCELSQLYLLDQTHTALTLNAECRDGLLQALEPSSLPADYTGEQLLQFALCQNRVVSLVDLPSRLHETGFLPAGAALAVPALRSAGEPGENGRGHGGLRHPAPTGPAGIRPSTGPAGRVRAGPAASAATPLATLRRAARTVQRTGGQRLRADRQERGDA